MKRATEILAMTKEAMAEILREREMATKNFLENEVSNAIESAAKDGRYSVKLEKISSDINLEVIVEELEELGFAASKKGRELKVEWYDWKVNK